MDVEIKPFGCFHRERCLHASGRNGGGGGIVELEHSLIFFAYFAQRTYCVFIFLSVVVAGNPVGDVVAGHGKLAALLFNIHIIEFGLLGEYVAETHSVVKHAELNLHDVLVGGLLQGYDKRIVVIPYLRFFAPHRRPSLVKRRCIRFYKCESACHIINICKTKS